MADQHSDKTPKGRLKALAEKLAQPELGRFQVALLAVLFACVWCVIGLLSGYLLSYLVVSMTTAEVDPQQPATAIFYGSLIACSGYGIIRGWRLFRAFNNSLEN